MKRIQAKALKDTLDLLIEVKERHVRTPEGSRLFHLPIGAPIIDHPTADVAKPDESLVTDSLEFNPSDKGYTSIEDKISNIPMPPTKYPLQLTLPNAFFSSNYFDDPYGLRPNIKLVKKNKLTLVVSVGDEKSWRKLYNDAFHSSNSKIADTMHPSVVEQINAAPKVLQAMNDYAEKAKDKTPIKKKNTPASWVIPSFSVTQKSVPGGLSFSSTDKKTGRKVEIIYKHLDSAKYQLVITEKGKKPESQVMKNIVVRRDVYGGGDRNYRYSEDDYPLLVERELKRPYIEKAYDSSRNTIPAHTTFSDLYNGIYGVDYIEHGDKTTKPTKLTDIKGRQLNIVKEQEELGIEVRRSSDESPQYVNFQAQELINGNARAMQDAFPGFNLYQPTYALNTRNGNAIAFNLPITSDVRQLFLDSDLSLWRQDIDNYQSLRSDHVDWNHSGIALSNDFFGNKFDATTLYMSYNETSDFHSVHTEDVKNTDLLNNVEKMLMSTLIHETGHTIMNMIIGKFEPDNPTSPGRQRHQEFNDAMTAILKKYGVVTEVPTQYPFTGKRKDYDTLTFDSDYVAGLLSRYGSTNLQELAAEAWTEYFFADSPRPLATEIGNLMADHLEKFIEAEGVNE